MNAILLNTSIIHCPQYERILSNLITMIRVHFSGKLDIRQFLYGPVRAGKTPPKATNLFQIRRQF